jgi:proline iminopeptidase
MLASAIIACAMMTCAAIASPMNTSTTVQLSDAARLRVWLLGAQDTSKPLLIALHGAPGLSSHTEPEAAYGFLNESFRVLVYDARGSGASDAKGPFTDERWVADIDELR